jgi:hypothetical protein
VNHGLKRIVVIGSDGVASFAALRWLADVGDKPALLEFRHASIGTSSFNTIFSSSRLLLPMLG